MAVYFIQAIDGGAIKIGATAHLKERLWSLSRKAGQELRIIAIVKGHYPEEKSLHRRFAHLRGSGEWFDPGQDLLDFIAAYGRPWDGKDEPPATPVKVWMDPLVLLSCRCVANLRGITIGEYLSETVREIAARDATAEGRLLVQRDKVTWPVDD